MNNSTGMEKYIETLDKIYNEGEEVCMNGYGEYTPSDISLILIGNQRRFNPENNSNKASQIKSQLALSAWMFKRIKREETKELIYHLSGYEALNGAYLNREMVEKIAKDKKYYQTVVKVLTEGEPLNRLDISGVEKNRVKQTILTVYRKTQDYTNIKKELVCEFFKNDDNDIYKELKMSILLMSPKKTLNEILQKSFDVSDFISLALFNSLDKRYKDEVFFPIIKILETIEYCVNCKKLKPSKSVIVAANQRIPMNSALQFFDGRNVKAPTLKEFIEITKYINKSIKMRNSEIRKKYKDIMGSNSRIMVMEFCKIDEFLSKGGTLYEAHLKFEPEMDVSTFYRSFKAWKKIGEKRMWADSNSYQEK